MLKNKIAVVTGANRGIGLAIARTFAAQGAQVIACMRTLDQSVLQEILEDTADIESVKRFLLSLHKKGETAEEVSALVEQLYRNALPINISERAVDTGGTGGDGAHTINISSTAAIVHCPPPPWRTCRRCATRRCSIANTRSNSNAASASRP